MFPDTIRCIECEKLLDPATRYLTCEGCRIMCMRTDCVSELSPIYAEEYAYCPECEDSKYECESCGETAFMADDECNTCAGHEQRAWDKSQYAL